MKTLFSRCFSPALAILLGIFATARAWTADAEAEVKRIVARVNAVDAQLERAFFFEKKTEKKEDGSTLTEQAWIGEAGDYLKVSEEGLSKDGRELAEAWFRAGNALCFVLEREEKRAADGTTRVKEWRSYYGTDSGKLVRQLTKDAVFKAGEPLETKATRNVSMKMADVPEVERQNHHFNEEAEKLIKNAVAAGPPKRDPTQGAPGDSARFRVIRDSTSPNGRYAVAIGFEEAPKSWDDYELFTDELTQMCSYWIEDFDLREKSRNYVVDLSTRRIVGETGGGAYGTPTSIGRGNWSFSWSPDSRWLVQETSDKWTSDASAHALDPEKGVIASGALDELAPRAEKFLAAKKDRALKTLGKDISALVNSAEVTNDGKVTVEVLPTQPGLPASFESPDVVERYQLKRSDGKVEVKFIDVSYAR